MTRLSADRISGALTLLLLAVLTLVAWLLATLGLQSPTVEGLRAPESLKASLQDILLERTDPGGQRHYLVRAQSGLLTEDGGILLEGARLERQLAGSLQTRIVAGAARMSADQSQILLTGGVETLQVTAGASSETTSLSTQELEVRPQEDRARAAGAVRIVQTGRTLTGQGLELDLKSGQYRLLANTRLELSP